MVHGHRYSEIEAFYLDRHTDVIPLYIFQLPLAFIILVFPIDILKDYRLVRRGAAIRGHISHKSGRDCQADYTYQPAGLHQICNSLTYYRADGGKVNIRSPVVVLYNPAKPDRSIVYDFCMFRAV